MNSLDNIIKRIQEENKCSTEYKDVFKSELDEFIIQRLESGNKLKADKKYQNIVREFESKRKNGEIDEDLNNKYLYMKDTEIIDSYEIGFKDAMCFLQKNNGKNNSEEIDNILEMKRNDIESNYIINNKDFLYNEHLRIMVEIEDYLKKCNLEDKIIEMVKKLLEEQQCAIDEEKEIWQNVFFKEGMLFYKNFFNELNFEKCLFQDNKKRDI